MREEIKVYVERLSKNIELPSYAHIGDSGMDVRASEDIIIHPQETKIVPTGLKFAIPEGYEIQVRARSGLSLYTPLRVANGIGTIDEGYRDEVGIIIHNSSLQKDISMDINFIHPITKKGSQQGSYLIQKGDRIAQLVLQRVPQIVWEEVEDVKDIGLDREGGFGSSGV